MKTKTITLSVEDWESIANAVRITWDEGPYYEGWKSAELTRAEESLNAALETATIIESEPSDQ